MKKLIKLGALTTCLTLAVAFSSTLAFASTDSGLKAKPMNGGNGGPCQQVTATDFNKLISANTSLTDAEKTTLTDAYTATVALRSQIDSLRGQERTADDTAKAALKTQIESLEQQVREQMDAVKDLMAQVMPESNPPLYPIFI